MKKNIPGSHPNKAELLKRLRIDGTFPSVRPNGHSASLFPFSSDWSTCVRPGVTWNLSPTHFKSSTEVNCRIQRPGEDRWVARSSVGKAVPGSGRPRPRGGCEGRKMLWTRSCLGLLTWRWGQSASLMGLSKSKLKCSIESHVKVRW